jgi:hypothetical protein
MTRIEKFYSALMFYGIVTLSVPLVFAAHVFDLPGRFIADVVELYRAAGENIRKVEARIKEARIHAAS